YFLKPDPFCLALPIISLNRSAFWIDRLFLWAFLSQGPRPQTEIIGHRSDSKDSLIFSASKTGEGEQTTSGSIVPILGNRHNSNGSERRPICQVRSKEISERRESALILILGFP